MTKKRDGGKTTKSRSIKWAMIVSLILFVFASICVLQSASKTQRPIALATQPSVAQSVDANENIDSNDLSVSLGETDGNNELSKDDLQRQQYYGQTFNSRQVVLSTAKAFVTFNAKVGIDYRSGGFLTVNTMFGADIRPELVNAKVESKIGGGIYVPKYSTFTMDSTGNVRQASVTIEAEGDIIEVFIQISPYNSDSDEKELKIKGKCNAVDARTNYKTTWLIKDYDKPTEQEGNTTLTW